MRVLGNAHDGWSEERTMVVRVGLVFSFKQKVPQADFWDLNVWVWGLGRHVGVIQEKEEDESRREE